MNNGQEYVDHLLSTVPEEAKHVVAKVKDSAALIHKCLAEETGLRLLRRRDSERDQIRIPPIRLSGSRPEYLNMLITDIPPRVMLLRRYRTDLEVLGQATARARKMLVALQEIDPGVPKQEEEQRLLEGVSSLVERWSKEGDAIAPMVWLREAERDVLGSYGEDVSHEKPVSMWRLEDTGVRLYWRVIGFTALMTKLDLGDLATVILIHELAHAFCHRGQDQDGQAWAAEDYFKSDKFMVEGLAQYYTGRVCTSVRRKFPGLRPVFDRFAEAQSEPYKVHRVLEERYAPETVRSGMLRIRRKGRGTWPELIAELRSI